ncbi:non-ribosomal peptide synthetase [Paenibacillus tarimensis]|uniref:non-ribosomal peptide synthetase n=1 Tax=Paenibacillus tarimensis TaxID=416012 RepID=UPI001F1AC2BE|nr:non-ribosomal peptide synthetase [Paenibacillus tarimensis]MCF2945317.1 amino acid adenylation domain-containing protein [Paenibacillus tarimensis]
MEAAVENQLFELTHAQKRIWYMEQIYSGHAFHNLSFLVRFQGLIQEQALEQAINHFVRQHAAIRYRMVEHQGDVRQYEEPFQPFPVDRLDLSRTLNPADEFVLWAEQEASRPFALTEEPLFRFVIARLSDEESGMYVKIHHIVGDGFSFQLIVDQLYGFYEHYASSSGSSDELDFPDYYGYISQEQAYLESGRFQKDRTFWLEQFARLPEWTAASSNRLEGRRRTFFLSQEQTSRVKEWIKRHNSSINTLFTSLFMIHMHKFYEQHDLVIGTPVSNHTMKFKQVFGMMTSTMPLRLHIDDEAMAAAAFIQKVDRQLQKCYKHQKYPYDLLVNELELKKHDIEQLLPFSVNYYHFQLNQDIAGIPTLPQEIYPGSQIYSLQLVISEWHPKRGLQMDYDYKTADYSEEDIGLLHESILTLLEQALSAPDTPLSELRLLSKPREEELVYSWNSRGADYPQDRTVVQLFEEQAIRTPKRIAVECGGKAWTYEELNKRVNRMAAYLRRQGIGRGKIAAIMAGHSAETVTAILAVHKAGGAYVPVDPAYPAERVQYMLDTAEAAVLLTDMAMNTDISYSGPVIRLDDDSRFAAESDANPEPVNEPRDLAYVIFTSGSTGRPKGVMIEHQGLTNYIWWARKVYTGADGIEVFPLYSSLAFDLTVTSIFTPLIAGHQIMVYPDDEHEFVLYRILRDNQATIMKLTPSHLGLFRDMRLDGCSVTKLIVGGEDLKVALCRQIHQQLEGNVRIFNEYGPTETVVGCMIHEFDSERDQGASVPIGVPADNVQIYVLDSRLQPVGVGASGEMYISGDGVARGYMNRPDLTEERFLPNPFIPGQRMYRTGDLARFGADGKLYYLGRTDHQVKIRGYRIELAEIEKQLLLHPGVKEAVVIDLEDESGSKALCGYIVPRVEDGVAAISPVAVPAMDSELRGCLAAELPQYMIPQHFVYLSEIPLTVNGKVDRSRLPQPAPAAGGTEMVDACSPQEEALLLAVRDVLGSHELGLGHNFYHAGGDSIKAIQISSKLAERGYRLKVKDMLTSPLLIDMARRMEAVQSLQPARQQQPCSGTVRPVPITSWFFAQSFSEPHYYHQSFLLRLKHQVAGGQLRAWLAALIERHDSLRLNVNLQRKELFYNDRHRSQHLVKLLTEVDLSGLPYEEQTAAIEDISRQVKASLDLQHDLLFRGCLFQLGEGEQRLLLTAHHLVIDGVSWRILLEDMQRIMGGTGSGQEIRFGPKTTSYQEWAEALNRLSEAEPHKNEEAWTREHWSGQLHPPVHIPLDRTDGGTLMGECDTVRITFGETETAHLTSDANKPYQTRTLELLLCALTRSLTRWTGGDEAVVMLEGHGREDVLDNIDLSETVGWFTTMYPVRLRREGEDLGSQIKSCKEQLRRVPHNGFYYGIRHYMPPRTADVAKERQLVRFNYLGELDRAFDTPYFELASESHGPDTGEGNPLTCLIDMNAYITGERLKLDIGYSTGQFRPETIRYFAEHLEQGLRDIIRHCVHTDQVDFTPSDFETVNISQEDLDLLFE